MTTANDTISDFITGRPKANAGAEANRQAVERLLVESKGYDRQEIEVDAPITLERMLPIDRGFGRPGSRFALHGDQVRARRADFT